MEIVGRVEEIAASKEVTPAQLAIAWVLAQGSDVVPIPGTKKRERLRENVTAVEVELSDSELEQLDSIASPRGDRYADMSSVGH